MNYKQIFNILGIIVGFVFLRSIFNTVSTAASTSKSVSDAEKSKSGAFVIDVSRVEGIADSVRGSIYKFFGLQFWGFDSDILENLNQLRNEAEVRYCCEYYKKKYSSSLKKDASEALNSSNLAKLPKFITGQWF